MKYSYPRTRACDVSQSGKTAGEKNCKERKKMADWADGQSLYVSEMNLLFLVFRSSCVTPPRNGWETFEKKFAETNYRYRHSHFPYKHTTCIPRWNDVETVVSKSFQRIMHVGCFVGLWNRHGNDSNRFRKISRPELRDRAWGDLRTLEKPWFSGKFISLMETVTPL